MKIVAAGTNPVQLTRGIEKTVAALVKELQKISVDVTDDDLINVATVSAGGNEVVSHSLFGSQEHHRPRICVLRCTMLTMSAAVRS